MDVFLHVKVLLSMILGLGVAHLLRGVGRIVQHPKKYRIYWVHLVWALFLFLYLSIQLFSFLVSKSFASFEPIH